MKALFTFFISCLSSIILAQAPFITTWKTDNPGTSDDQTIQIPLHSGSNYDFEITWGDGVTENYAGLGTELTVAHTYSNPGIYSVEISGVFPRLSFNIGGDKEKILSVDQWGDIGWLSFESAFQQCVNLQVLATDAPDLFLVTSMKRMFLGASSLNENINHWDVSTITDMSSLFAQATSFDQPLNNWDVSSVENMAGMFSGAFVFNQPIGGWNTGNVQLMNSFFGHAHAFNQPLEMWNTSNVLNMENMFYQALAFNQPIGNWDVSQVTNMKGMFLQTQQFNQPLNDWDVSNVQDFMHTFGGTGSFNQPLDNWQLGSATVINQMFSGAQSFNQALNSWDVSGAEILYGMFNNATSFNQPLNNWDVSNAVNAANMFMNATSFNQNLGSWNLLSCWDVNNMLSNCGMSYCNYDATLQGWAAQELNNGQTLGAMGLEYTADGETARQSIIDNHGWEITGDVLIVPDAFVVTPNVNGPEITIDVTGGGGNYTYTWSGPNGFNSSENSIVAPQNGLYTVIVTDGCEIWSDSFEVLTVQIFEVENTKVQIYPNPSNGQVQIVAPSTQHLALYDHCGRMVLKTNINAGNQYLDLSSLLPGVYSGSLISLSGEFLQTVRLTLVR
jgi:surface protein